MKKGEIVCTLDFLADISYFFRMKATLTSKGQITIPVKIRSRLQLKSGDVLDFDESAPFLKATKTISPEAWARFGAAWQDPWPALEVAAVLDEMRGVVELPPGIPTPAEA